MIEEMRVKQWQAENPYIDFKFWLMEKLDSSEVDNTGLRATLRDEIMRAEAAEARADTLAKALDSIKTTLAVGRNVGEDKEQAYQDAEETADAAIAKAEAMTA